MVVKYEWREHVPWKLEHPLSVESNLQKDKRNLANNRKSEPGEVVRFSKQMNGEAHSHLFFVKPCLNTLLIAPFVLNEVGHRVPRREEFHEKQEMSVMSLDFKTVLPFPLLPHL